MIAVDIDGFAIVINLVSSKTIAHFNFKNPIEDLLFSPDGKLLAVKHGPLLLPPQNNGGIRQSGIVK